MEKWTFFLMWTAIDFYYTVTFETFTRSFHRVNFFVQRYKMLYLTKKSLMQSGQKI